MTRAFCSWLADRVHFDPCFFLAVLLVTGGLAHPCLADEEPDRRTIRALPVGQKITIDGVIDEAAWQLAEPSGDFRQADPNEGEPATEATEIRVLFDEHSLYIAIRLYDSAPAELIAKQMVLDADMTSDDRINLILDTFDDKRNGYFFQINPIGTRSDALIENNSRFRRDWNGIWYAEAQVDAQGWTAEFEIPFKTVAFAKDASTWGFEVERIAKRKNEKTRWANSSANRSVLNVAGIGRIVGLADLDGTGIDLVPSASIQQTRTREQGPNDSTQHDDDTDLKASGDIFYKFHPSVTAGVTINTDFLETPVDDRRTILSRFPPSLPERRAFFLQDAGIFEFGGLTGNGTPYLSRRVGRLNGDILDIDGGTKLTGRLGHASFGGLYVHLPAQKGIDATDLAVGRVQYNVLEGSAIGLIGTYGDPRDLDENGLVGADFQYFNSRFQDDDILKGNVYFMQSITGSSGRSQQAFGANLEYPNDRYNGHLAFSDTGNEFNPALGFATRRGIRRYDGHVRYRVRPHSVIRTADTRFAFDIVTNRDDELETARLTFNLLELRNNPGDRITFSYVREYEHLRRRPFPVDPNAIIPLGEYTFGRYSARLEAANSRPIRPILEVVWGTYYSGSLTQWIGTLELRPTRYLFVSLAYEQNEGDLREGDFTQRLARIRLNLAFTTDVSWVNSLQYDNGRDSMGLNSIFRWQIQPGNDLYMVFNYHWDERNDKFIPTETSAAIKLAWTFRF